MFRRKNKQWKQSTEDCVASEESDGDPTFGLSGELGYFVVPLLEEILWKFPASYGGTSFELDLMQWGRLLTQVSSASSSRRDCSRPQ